jgi:hypothetical protein
METVLCAAVDTVSHQHVLESCTVCGKSETVLKNDKAVSNPSALIYLVQIFKLPFKLATYGYIRSRDNAVGIATTLLAG